MGIDEQSKGARIYWLDKKTVSIKRNIYYNRTIASASRFKEEEQGIVKMKANSPQVSNLSNTSISSKDNPLVNLPAPVTPPHIPSLPPASQPIEEEPPITKQARKLSQQILDIVEGHSVASSCPSDPLLTRGVQAPTSINKEPNVMLEGEGQADWMMAADFVEEYALAVEISEAEALEQHTLTKAKHHPNWLLWEKAIHKELETLNQAGT